MVTEIEHFKSPDLAPLVFVCGSGWRAKFTKERLTYGGELFARIWDAAASIKKREDQLRRTARDLHTRVANCIDVGGEIF